MGRAKAAQVLAETSTGPGMKSLSWGIGANVQRPTPNVQRRTSNWWRLAVVLDEADVAAALDPRDFDLREIFRLRAQAQIFLEIVLGDVRTRHLVAIENAVAHENVLGTLDPFAESMGAERDRGKKPVE